MNKLKEFRDGFTDVIREAEVGWGVSLGISLLIFMALVSWQLAIFVAFGWTSPPVTEVIEPGWFASIVMNVVVFGTFAITYEMYHRLRLYFKGEE